MFNYLLYFALLTPLIGIILMEQGAFGISCIRFGYANGAVMAYSAYIIMLLFSYYIIAKRKIFNFKTLSLSIFQNIDSLYIIISIVNLIFLFIMLFVFGGINVFLGTVQKGEFRISFGFFGSIAFMITKYFAPALLCYLTLIYTKHQKTFLQTFFLLMNFFVVSLIGSCWGYKSSAALILIPALTILFWKISFRKIVFIGILCVISFMFFGKYFEKKTIDFSTLTSMDFSKLDFNNAAEVVIYRLTVMQGEVGWRVWDMYKNNEPLPQYAPTLLAVFGDKTLALFGGITVDDYREFIKYHYGFLLTYVMGNTLNNIKEGHNITGTVFSEGIIAGGIAGLIIFSILAGLLTGINYQLIANGIKTNRPILSSMASVYFCYVLFAWLIGGNIVGLMHISIIIGFILTYLLLKFIMILNTIALNFYSIILENRKTITIN